MDLICEVNQRQMIIKNLDLIDALFKAVLRRFLFSVRHPEFISGSICYKNYLYNYLKSTPFQTSRDTKNAGDIRQPALVIINLLR